LTSSPNTRRRYALNFRPQLARIGLKNNPLPSLPSSWLPSGTRLFDFSPDSDLSSTNPTSRSWEPLSHQRPSSEDWDVWLVLGGRGTGKTRAGAEFVLEHLNTLGTDARVGIGAPTAADVRDVCAEGVSGLITIARDQFTSYNRSLGEAHHHRGGYVKFLGAEEPARWNGPQWSLLWADELALWNQDTWEQAQFGLRLGDRPRAIATTTPKARQFVRDLAERTGTLVTHARTADNPYLSEIVRQRLYDRYGGTRLGRQELEAEWLDDVPGALWTRDILETNRVREHPDLVRIVVAIDPSGGESEGHAEVGIVAAGKGADGHGYVLRDVSERLSPERWARRAVQLYYELKADRLLAEQNFGGEMVRSTIRAVDPNVPVKLVTASRGKRVRAEPVSALDEQGRIHHVGMLPVLEDQLCQWVPDSGDPSPDRLDARVWAITELFPNRAEVTFI
jgi:phage terminase large subunit-like protein